MLHLFCKVWVLLSLFYDWANRLMLNYLPKIKRYCFSDSKSLCLLVCCIAFKEVRNIEFPGILIRIINFS
jgi:hypothetical protein